MHTIIETHSYLRDAKDVGVSESERQAIVELIAANPIAGDIMAGCGGARKLRVPAKGKGKSGGYRVITYYGGVSIPVFLITIFAKGDKVNLSKQERNALAEGVKRLSESLNRKD